MHPVQHAIAALHKATDHLHHASVVAGDDHHKMAELLIGLLPEVMSAAQDLVTVAWEFITTR